MRTAFESMLAWWIAGPVPGLVIVTFLGLAGNRFGVLVGVSDLVDASAEGRGLRSRRTLPLCRVPDPIVEGADAP